MSAERDGQEEGAGDLDADTRKGKFDDGGGGQSNRARPEDLDGWEDKLNSLKKAVEDMHIEAAQDGQYMAYTKEHDRIERVKEADDVAVYRRLQNSLGGLNTVRNQIANMFLTQTMSRWIPDREEGRVNGRALCKVKAGYKNVFREKYVARDTDTAVTFLVDCSGSMSCDDRIGDAFKAVVLFMEVLKQTKIKYEVLGYSTDAKQHFEGNWRHEERYGRVEGLRTYILKEFDEPLSAKVQRRISNYNSIQRLNNCDPESVKIAHDRLLPRPERRKILFVLTDGISWQLWQHEVRRKILEGALPGDPPGQAGGTGGHRDRGS